MKFKKFGALLLSAVLCIGMAAPAFAYEGDTAPVEEPVLPEVVEEDVVTVTDETSGALTPGGQPDAGGRLPHRLFRWQRTAVYYAGVEVRQHVLSGHRPQCQGTADRPLHESGG